MQISPPIPQTDEQFHLNKVEVEGIVTRIWARRLDVLARLAVYDKNTTILDPKGGNDGRPLRQAHYVTVLFEEGKVGGSSVSLKRKDRVRISGFLRDEAYFENLRRFLIKAQKVDVLSEMPNSDDLAEIRVSRVATYIIARSLIQFTRA